MFSSLIGSFPIVRRVVVSHFLLFQNNQWSDRHLSIDLWVGAQAGKMDSCAWRTGIRAGEKTREEAEVPRGPQVAATRASPASEGALGPPLLRSPPSSPAISSPPGLWPLRPESPASSIQAAAELPAPQRNQKKPARVRARAARGRGAAVFSVPGAQNIDLITPRKRGHNIFGCISKLN